MTTPHNSAPRLRAAIVGCGKIADAHAEQIRALGRAELVAVCDREPLMAEQLSLRFGEPAQYTDLGTLLTQQRIDVLHVATPPGAHLPIARQAFAAGCHVFMEKPFAPTAPEAAEILKLAAQAGRQIGVNYLYNFETPGLQLEQLLAAQALGDPVHFDVAYGYNLAGDYGVAVMADPAHWVHSLPGKLFHNVLDHVLAKVVAHLGDDFALELQAFRRRPASGNPVLDALDDELRLLIRSGDVTVSALVSAHGRPVAHSLKVIGTRDSVELDYACRTLVRSARQSQPSAVGRLFPPWLQALRFAGNGARNALGFARSRFHFFEGMRVLLGRFYDAVEGRGPAPVAPAEILRVCRIIDAIVAKLERPA
jgi:predicted dehydrogenase